MTSFSSLVRDGVWRPYAALACAALTWHAAGCATTPSEPRTAGPAVNSIQVQFYAPDGGQVSLRGIEPSAAEMHSSGPLGNRLEQQDAYPAVYDLRPGRYAFAYTYAPGASEATIYGELELRAPKARIARRYCAHSFVPIRLPSESHQVAPHLHPLRDVSYTVGLEDRRFDHLRQGDLVTDVLFVADLDSVRREYEEDYYHAINDIDRELAVLADRDEYLTARYDDEKRRALRRMPELDLNDRLALERHDVWGIEEPFIVLSRKIQALQKRRDELMLERRRLEDERSRRNALLRSMRVVHRAGALVLASPDLQRPYSDPVEQVSALGEVVAVVRVGGRHQYWAWSSGDASMPMQGDPIDEGSMMGETASATSP